MSDRHCPYCQQVFQLSPYRPQQAVCSQISCQRRRRRGYHRDKIHSDPLYADTVSRSRKKWRDAHPGYQKQYWQTHPEARERNRQQQRRRDRRRRLRHLVKNNLALDLKCFPAEAWLLRPVADDLVKNTPLALPPAAVYKRGMLKVDHINEIHRLAVGERWSLRRIARQLHMDTRTVKKYLHSPVPLPVHRPRPSKLDPFKPLIAELLEQDPRAPGSVILQRLRAAGFAGGA
jgi:hypothetical protein